MSGRTGRRDGGADDPAEPQTAHADDSDSDLAHAPTLAVGSTQETRTSAPTPAGVTPRVAGVPLGETRADETRDERRPGVPRAVSAGPARDLPFVDPSHYEIAGEHARGGLGRVLRARDRRLERTVALKELAHGPSSRTAARFVREALVTARLQHPSIVPVYEAGRWPSGDPFYAMKLVSGETLDDAIEKRPTLDARLALLPHVLAVSEAVAYAHSEGVIHRDLKPANVMLGAFGETQVVDWGLAKDRRLAEDPEAAAADGSLYAHAHADMTRVGTVVGTPAYMAPEQARGEEVDERADVYAIGAMLYHLLAAEAPFEGAPDTVVARVAKDAPTPLAERTPEAPRDLIAIVDKAMARDASARYPTAKELAQDLSRFLTGQLVGARSYGRVTLILRWLRRNRNPVAVAAVLLAILAATAVTSASRIVHERNFANGRSAQLILTQARSMLERDPTAALAWLKQYPDDGSGWVEARSIAADAVSRGITSHVFGDHPEQVNASVFSPDGSTVATASGALIQYWDVPTGRRLRRIHLEDVSQLAFSPDGRWLAAGGSQGGIWLLPAHGDGQARLLGRHSGWVGLLAFTPDGKGLATSAFDGVLRFWAVDTGLPRELGRDVSVVEWARFVDDGRSLLTSALDGKVVRWDISGGGSRVLFLVPDPESQTKMEASTDGRRILVSVGDRLLLWEEGAEPRELGHTIGAIRDAILSPDGSVVSGGDDATVTWWSLNGERKHSWLGHQSPISALAISADGSTVASADTRGDIRLWRTDGTRVLRGHARSVTRLAFSPDGTNLLSSGDDDIARLWPITTQGRLERVATSDVFRVAFMAGGTSIATTSRDGGVRVLSTGDGSVSKWGSHDVVSYDLELLPDDRGFVTGSWDGSVAVWRDASGPVRMMRHGAHVTAVAVSHDGLRAASAGEDGRVVLWDLATGGSQVVYNLPVDANDVSFSPDDHFLAVAADDGIVRVRDLRNGSDRLLQGHEGPAPLVVFGPSGELFSSGWDGTVRAWNLATGQATVNRGHEGHIRALAVSPDGRWVASGATDKQIVLWNPPTGQTRVLRGHEAEVRHLAFSPDGTELASAGWDQTVRLWSIEDGHMAVMRGHAGLVHRVAFSPDGRLLASGGQDGAVGLWKVSQMEQVPERPSALRDWLAKTTSATVNAEGRFTYREAASPRRH